MTEKEPNIEKIFRLGEVEISFDNPKYRSNHYTIYNGKLINNEEITVTVFNKEDATDDKIKCFIDILQSIQLSNFETFLGDCQKESLHYVITKREGKNLSELLKKKKRNMKKPLRRFNRTIIAFKIALTMAYLHSINIIHGDLCTSNINIDKNCKPIIINFTNSCFFNEDTNIAHEFDTVSTFNSPEFLNGSNYNKSVDVFLFAGILYELLMSHPPFYGLSKSEIENKIESGERPELKENINVLKELIEKCWAKEPKDRPTFNEIIYLMITKKIAFPNEDNEVIEQFYSQYFVDINNKIHNCIEQFKSIDENININERFTFKKMSLRIQNLLQEYRYHLQMLIISSQMNSSDLIFEVRISHIFKLLKDLQDLLSQTTEEKWKSYSLYRKSTEILEDIYCKMEQIYIEMNELGFNVNKYEYDKSYLSEDLSELYEMYRSNSDYDYAKISQRLSEIEAFSERYSIPLKLNPKNNKFAGLFSQFKSYEISKDELNLDDIIGDGMSSIVYKATVKDGRKIKNSDKNEYAIKEIKEDFLRNKSSIILLEREISFLVMLHHEYIANFVGFNFDDDHIWIISELASDGNLFDAIIQKHKKLNSFQRTKIAFEIAEGMEYLHSKDIIHRDLKSLNVLLDGDTPKITDFGLARHYSSDEMTREVGTRIYMAPEVIKGHYYDFKADIYSYACLLWELYSNRIPLDDCCDGRNNELEFKKPISKDLKELINKGRSINPQCRPTFTEIINLMIKQKIAFSGADEKEVDEFYKKKAEKRKTCSH